MSALRLTGSTSGYSEITPPAIAGDQTFTLPGTGGTLTTTNGGQTIEHAAGTASAPSITFTGDVNTGIFSPAADTIAFAEGGVEAARIDSSGRLLVGTSSTSGNLTLLLEGNNGSTGPGILSICTTDTTPTDGADLGYVAFGDTAQGYGAWINVQRDGGTWSGSSRPARLVFSTTADGASSPTERMRITSTGEYLNYDVYTRTTANAANVHVQSDGSHKRSTSSGKYKTNVETLQDSYADKILDCRPVWYRSTCASDNPAFGWWGFIAEEVAEIDPRLVHWKTTEPVVQENGSIENVPCDPEPEGVAYDRFVPHLLNLIKRQGEAIAELQAEVAALKGA